MPHQEMKSCRGSEYAKYKIANIESFPLKRLKRLKIEKSRQNKQTRRSKLINKLQNDKFYIIGFK